MGPKLVKAFISYAHKDSKKVDKILNKLVQRGIRIDVDIIFTTKKYGKKLDETIIRRIESSTCSILFLSKNSIKSEYVMKEIEKFIELSKNGKYRAIPVMLGPKDKILKKAINKGIIEEFLDLKDGNENTLYIKYKRCKSTPIIADELLESIFDHYEIKKKKSIAIHAGHRLPKNRIDFDELPINWKDCYVLDFRSNYKADGNKGYIPSRKEWREIEEGIKAVRDNVPKFERIYFFGKTMVGFGFLIGKWWNRQEVNQYYTWNYKKKKEWIINLQSEQFEKKFDCIEAQELMKKKSKTCNIVIGERDDIVKKIKKINKKDNLIKLKIDTKCYDNSKIYGIITNVDDYIKQIPRKYEKIRIYTSMPLNLCVFIAWYIRPSVKTEVYDHNRRNDKYELVTDLNF